MPVIKRVDGSRCVEAEVEVPGTPEEVWAAIATGPGISSWFVPTRVVEGPDGEICSRFGCMEAATRITSWEPPYRLVLDSSDETGPDGPAVATEWLVEARDGGSCTVRVLQRWFSDADNWDEQFEGQESGWIAVLRILKLYLSEFPRQTAASIQLMGAAGGPQESGWREFLAALGIEGAEVGDQVRCAPEWPPLGGEVLRRNDSEQPLDLLLRLKEPAPGFAFLFAAGKGAQCFVGLRLFLFGEGTAAALARDEPRWNAWFADRYPM